MPRYMSPAAPSAPLHPAVHPCIISVGLMYITKHYRHRNWPQNSFNLFILYLHVKLYRLWKCKLDFCISAAVCRAVRVMWRSYIITFRIILHLYVTDLSPLQSERKELWTNIWIKSATIIVFILLNALRAAVTEGPLKADSFCCFVLI